LNENKFKALKINAVSILYKHVKRYLKRLKMKKNDILIIQKKYNNEIMKLKEKENSLRNYNIKLKQLLKLNNIHIPENDEIGEEGGGEKGEGEKQEDKESNGEILKGEIPSPASKIEGEVLPCSSLQNELNDAKSTIQKLKLELNKEKHSKELELSKMALNHTANKSIGRKNEVISDNLKSENNQLIIDIAKATQKLTMKQLAEKEAYIRLKNVLNSNENKDDGEMDSVNQDNRQSPRSSSEDHSDDGKNWNFEAALNDLIDDYEKRKQWKDSMDNHVESLSTKLEQFNYDSTVNRTNVTKYETTVSELNIVSKKYNQLQNKMDNTLYKLSLSEKSNGLLASKLSMKSDQLKDFVRRANTVSEPPSDNNTTDKKEEDNEELLKYLRTFAAEWGHSTYAELQGFVGYDKKNNSCRKESRRKRSIGLF
jgi:hypothetical protein